MRLPTPPARSTSDTDPSGTSALASIRTVIDRFIDLADRCAPSATPANACFRAKCKGSALARWEHAECAGALARVCERARGTARVAGSDCAASVRTEDAIFRVRCEQKKIAAHWCRKELVHLKRRRF
jgi:hypothetical protein